MTKEPGMASGTLTINLALNGVTLNHGSIEGFRAGLTARVLIIDMMRQLMLLLSPRRVGPFVVFVNFFSMRFAMSLGA